MSQSSSLLRPAHVVPCASPTWEVCSGYLTSPKSAPSPAHSRSKSWASICLDPAVQQPQAGPMPLLGPSTLEELPPGILLHVLEHLKPLHVARLQRCSRALASNVAAACEGWRTKVEELCRSSPAGAKLLQLLLHPGAAHGPPCRRNWLCVWTCLQRARQGPWTLDVSRLSRAASPEGVLLLLELLLTTPHPPMGAATSGAAAEVSDAPAQDASSCSSGDRASSTGVPPAGAPSASPAVVPAASVATPAGSGGSSHAGWVAPIPVASLVLDGHQVVVLVEPSGRVTSPQQDWAQGSIQLQPGVPQVVAVEVSYICPVPSWSLHPCRPHAPGSAGPLALDLRQGCGSYVHDPRYLEQRNGEGSGALLHPGVQACVVGAGSSLVEVDAAAKPVPNKVVALLNRLLPGKGSRCGGGSLGRGRLAGGGSAGGAGSSKTWTSGPAAAPSAYQQQQGRSSHGQLVADNGPGARGAAAGGRKGGGMWSSEHSGAPAGAAMGPPGTLSAVGSGRRGGGGVRGSSKRRGGYTITCTGITRDGHGSMGLGTRNNSSSSWGAASDGEGDSDEQEEVCGAAAGGSSPHRRPVLPVVVQGGSAWALPADPSLRFQQGFITSFEHQKAVQLLQMYGQLPPGTGCLLSV